MSRLLEILGKAGAVDTSEFIFNYIKRAFPYRDFQNIPLNKCINLIDEKKIHSAEQELRLYLFENPDCIYGRLASAGFCLCDSKLTEAIKELNCVYSKCPNNTIALYALGHCYERLGKEAKAVEFYQDCLKFKSYFQEPAHRLSAIYFKNGELDKAVQQYKWLCSEYPDDMSMLLILGYLYLDAGKSLEAGEIFNRAILMLPDDLYADFYVDQLIAEGRLNEALSYIEQICQDQPESADLLLKYGDIFSLMGTNDLAIEKYELAINCYPDFLEGRIKLGTLYLRENNIFLAAEQFNKAIEINDNIVDAYIGLSLSQYMQNDTASANETLMLAASIQPNSAILFAETACLNLRFFYFSNDFDNPENENDCNDNCLLNYLIEVYFNQIKKCKDDAELYYRFGVLMMSINRFNDASISFENSLEIYPQFTAALNNLSLCLLNAGKSEEAFQRLLNSINLDRNSVNLHYNTVILYFDKLRFASSVLNLDRNYKENYSHVHIAKSMSLILQNLGILSRTEAVWDNLVQTMNNDYDS